MFKFLKNHWLLVLSFILLVLMDLPIFYFGNLLKMLDNRMASQVSVPSVAAPAVGISLNDMIDSRWSGEKSVWTREANAQKSAVQIRVAHHSLARQIRQIRNLIGEKVKVLIVVPVRQDGLAEVFQEAAQKNIKIILYDDLTAGPANLYCGLDYREIGRTQALYMTKNIGPGNYLVIKGPAYSYKLNRIAQGQMEVLKGLSQKGFHLLTIDLSSEGRIEEAVLKVRVMAAHQKISAVLAPNDVIAEEIIRLFKKQNLKLPFIGGINGEMTALQRIENGEQMITIIAAYDQLAQIAYRNALRLNSGKRVSVLTTMSFNSNKIPSVLIPFRIITHDNVESQIKKEYGLLKE